MLVSSLFLQCLEANQVDLLKVSKIYGFDPFNDTSVAKKYTFRLSEDKDKQ